MTVHTLNASSLVEPLLSQNQQQEVPSSSEVEQVDENEEELRQPTEEEQGVDDQNPSTTPTPGILTSYTSEEAPTISSSLYTNWCSTLCCCCTYICCCFTYICCRCKCRCTNHRILALSSTTHTIAAIAIPLCIILTHVLFLYGQTVNMWSLLLHTNIDVSYNVKSSLSRVTFDILKLPHSYQYTIQEKDTILRTFTYVYAMKELWYPKHMDGVGLFLPRLASVGLFLFSGVWPHVKLLALNVVWFTPFTTITSSTNNNSIGTLRSRILNHLSIFGKWSLVDVLVVCIMVGVLHLQYNITSTDTIMENVSSHLNDIVHIIQTLYTAEDLCSMSLKYSCDHPKKWDRIAECQACLSTIKTWFHHPDGIQDIIHGIETSGNGTITLSVIGLNGIYAFCIAVILSIVISFIVDYYDLQSRLYQEQQLALTVDLNDTIDSNEHRTMSITQQLATTFPDTTTNEDDPNDDAILNQLLLAAENSASNPHRNNNTRRTRTTTTSSSLPSNSTMNDVRSAADRNYDRNIRVDQLRTRHIIWQIISYISFLLILIPIINTTMERKVYGAIPMFLQNVFNVVWTKQYNFISLAYTTALAGKWDYLLMTTFVWFIIAGPIIRSILCIIANHYNETSAMSETTVIQLYRRKRYISICIDFIGAFCAWEVFTIAVLMVDLLMPSITSTIFIDPRCAQITPLLSSFSSSFISSSDSNSTTEDNDTTKNTSCFEVDFNIHKVIFSFVIMGGIMLLVVSRHVRGNLFRTT